MRAALRCKRLRGCPPCREAVLKIKRSKRCFILEKRELRFRFLMWHRLNVDMRSILEISNHSVVDTERNRPFLSVEREDDGRENIVQKQHRHCVADRRCTGGGTQNSGMLLLCFKSLCERLSGQQCVDATLLGYTHKASRAS